jgi:hypothetical protein
VGRPAAVNTRERVGLRRVGGEVAWVKGGFADGCELSTRFVANGYAAGDLRRQPARFDVNTARNSATA